MLGLNRLRQWLGTEEAAAGWDVRLRLAQALTGERPAPGVDDPLRDAFRVAAERHGVAGLLGHLGPDFERSAMALKAKGIRALRFTLRVTKALDEAGVVHAVMKGATSAARWPEPSARVQSDVDVLVHRGELSRASEAMVKSGLASHQFIAGEVMHNAALQPKEPGGLLIELHHALTSHHDVRLDVSELIERRVQLSTPQGPVWGLAPEDDAVYLALHASTHALHRLAWLVDLWRLGVAGVDWIEAARRAREGNVGGAVELAWRETRELFGAPIGEAAFDELGVGAAQRLRYRALYRLTHRTQGAAQQFFERGFRMALVPLGDMPRVLRFKLRAREEEAAGYTPSPDRRGPTDASASAGRG
jgi:hypothetical protein